MRLFWLEFRRVLSVTGCTAPTGVRDTAPCDVRRGVVTRPARGAGPAMTMMRAHIKEQLCVAGLIATVIAVFILQYSHWGTVRYRRSIAVMGISSRKRHSHPRHQVAHRGLAPHRGPAPHKEPARRPDALAARAAHGKRLRDFYLKRPLSPDVREMRKDDALLPPDAVRGRAAATQGRGATAAQGRVGVGKGRIGVVKGRIGVVKGRIGVAKGRIGATKGRGDANIRFQPAAGAGKTPLRVPPAVRGKMGRVGGIHKVDSRVRTGARNGETALKWRQTEDDPKRRGGAPRHNHKYHRQV